MVSDRFMSNDPQYTLEKTVTGKVKPKAETPKQEPVVLEDAEGNKLHAPWAPKENCKRCYGRGFIGKDAKTNELIPCRKCYPWKA